MSEFYDANSPLGSTTREDKSGYDPETEVAFYDNCENIILQEIKNGNKLQCPKCGNICNPHYELIQVQDRETTIDELSSEAVLSTKSDEVKIRTTLNREKGNKHENLKYVKKEFERYKEIEIIDKDTISTKTRRSKIAQKIFYW
ncbi:hypothetical protein [Candidatus Nitrosocosmicus sp. SS]|jgi:DNA-directed RNA polymerase subunit M/transcription elongation factor TFIIS|uniref:hypothetical protein n=1 Tax=Candidatus Nitrosocosmicus agrestis TaxID=2563600 RepID=UPI00122DEE34|nr:hypothetical protein [Candidatus Nitrosocosmicus sp. SS]KAA2282181.1 hypothetical protein F1Z66_07050 [Candidatus Nitrosocosmicus sp. SS]KAF0869973.1 hypothetical protein E5N71_01760 [Candidatus Nitrosocosmicus sp. SS]